MLEKRKGSQKEYIRFKKWWRKEICKHMCDTVYNNNNDNTCLKKKEESKYWSL